MSDSDQPQTKKPQRDAKRYLDLWEENLCRIAKTAKLPVPPAVPKAKP